MPQFRTPVPVGFSIVVEAVPPAVRNDVGDALMPVAPRLPAVKYLAGSVSMNET